MKMSAICTVARYLHGGPVPASELVVTGGHGAELLSPVHQPLDRVALPLCVSLA
jgi:hypothetical protein